MTQGSPPSGAPFSCLTFLASSDRATFLFSFTCRHHLSEMGSHTPHPPPLAWTGGGGEKRRGRKGEKREGGRKEKKKKYGKDSAWGFPLEFPPPAKLTRYGCQQLLGIPPGIPPPAQLTYYGFEQLLLPCGHHTIGVLTV